MKLGRSALLAGILTSAIAGCAGAGRVDRIVDGRMLSGPAVDPDAYERYARAALLEATGDLSGADAAYTQAIDVDPDSPELWTRLGALRCRRRDATAFDAFARAEALDSGYEPAWHERARCHLREGRPNDALPAAQAAFRLDPEREDGTLLLAELHVHLRHVGEARSLLEALVVRRPDSRAGWEALEHMAEQTHDAALAHRAAAGLRRLDRRTEHAGGRVARPAMSRIDRALIDGDLDAAREAAIKARMPSAEVALRAAALGRAALAGRQAELVLAADPANTDARIAALAAADLTGDAAALAHALVRLDAEPLAPSALATRLFADLLRRRVGDEAARAWLDASGPLPEPADELEQAVDRRFR